MPPADDPLVPLLADTLDRNALARLVALEQPSLQHWLVRVLRDDELAQDALQETWLIIAQGAWRFTARSDDPAGDVRAWLRQIALRSALRLRARTRAELRQRQRWFRRQPATAVEPTPLERMADREREEMVLALVADLPSPLRQVLDLRYRDGLDYAAIGRVQGCTALAARLRAWRGLARLRRALLLLGIAVAPAQLIGASLARTLADGTAVGWHSGHSPSLLLPLTWFAPHRWQAAAAVLVLAAAVAVWWPHTARPRMSDAGDQEAAPEALQDARMTQAHARPPWLLTDGTSTVRPTPRKAWPDEDDHNPEDADGTTIRLEARMIEPGKLGDEADPNHPTLLSWQQTHDLLECIAHTPSASILQHPTITIRSGQKGQVSVVEQHAYICGYALVGSTPDPKITVLDSGATCTLRASRRQQGILLTEARTRFYKPEFTTRTARIPGGREGLDYPWEEVIAHGSWTIELPTGGVLIPRDASLLVPAAVGVIQTGTPAGVVEATDVAFHPWWLLITPQGLPDEPALPSASD
jgi:RNA polymerase sigma factor (sigma-70 family)